MLKILRRSWPAIAWYIFIHCLFLFPFHGNPDNSLDLFPNFDKLVHFGLFFTLCLLIGIYVGNKYPEWVNNKYWILLLPFLAMLDGIAVEFLQKLPIIHRDFEWFDALADTLGAIAGTYAAVFLLKKFRA